jgi:hypothetical protein
MSWIKTLAAVAVVAVGMAGCGGGGGSAGTPVLGGGNGEPPAVVAADLLVAAPAQLANTPSSTATVTVTALDSSRNTVAGVPVNVTVDNGAIVTASSTETDAQGKFTASVLVGADRSNRVITATVTSGSLVRTVQIQVTGTKITTTLVPAVLAPGETGQVRFLAVDQAGDKMPNQAVAVSAPGLIPAEASGTTNSDGEFVFNYQAPATAGSYIVSATIAGQTDPQTLVVQTVNMTPSVTATIKSASVSANPSVVGVNTAGSSTINRTEIRALFLSDNNQPIPNVRVRFDLADDVNSIGGTFTTGTQVLYTNANGIATTAYMPSTRDSPTNGVTIRACYGVSDIDPNLINCTTSAVTTLTVTNSPLAVSIGTNEKVIDNDLSYIKQFLVSVVDASGAAKADVNLTVSVDLPQYRKGQYAAAGDEWVKLGSMPDGSSAWCANEDTNRNGALEIGEDTDVDGRLDPGKSDVSVTLLQSKTRADGTAVLQIQYAKSFGTWVDAWITVAASGVSGTEGRATYVLAPLPVAALAITTVDVTPAFQKSPYGVASSCADKN